MLDIKSILANKEYHMNNARLRRSPVDLVALENTYQMYRNITEQVMQLRRHRNRLAAEYAQSKPLGETLVDFDDAITVKEQLEALTKQLGQTEEQLHNILALLPNETHPKTPLGDAQACREVRRFGPIPSITPNSHLDHTELGQSLDIIDFEAGARVAGSSFYFLKGKGALLENALVQYALKTALQAGFQPIIPPDFVYGKYVRACGFLPRADDPSGTLPVYTVEEGDAKPVREDRPLKTLAATSEIPLAAYYAGRILTEKQVEQFPIKWVAISHCFRPETGHHGADTRGLYRVHQFTKVELFIIKDDDLNSSNAILEELVTLQEQILAGLELPSRVMEMSTEELGASAYRKYDIETYFPGRGGWGEVTSASNCTDYQARRLSLRYRERGTGEVRFVHTLNGTAMAVPRLIQAILENNKQANGSVELPSVLHPFMLDGSQEISA